MRYQEKYYPTFPLEVCVSRAVVRFYNMLFRTQLSLSDQITRATSEWQF